MLSESDYINKPKYRNAVKGLIEIEMAHITKSKRMTKIKQSEIIVYSQSTFKTKWEPRLIELETYLHQAAQQMHKNI